MLRERLSHGIIVVAIASTLTTGGIATLAQPVTAQSECGIVCEHPDLPTWQAHVQAVRDRAEQAKTQAAEYTEQARASADEIRERFRARGHTNAPA